MHKRTYEWNVFCKRPSWQLWLPKGGSIRKNNVCRLEPQETLWSGPISAEFWSWGPKGKLHPTHREKGIALAVPRSKGSALGTGSLDLLCESAVQR